ncbi:MAG TPA: CHAD domain-containing protein [Roseiarcus sp.]|nr:CHAD domain-containing protein [Roseiarcus sp.]
MPAGGDDKSRDPWPDYCRRRLIAAILGAADIFPHPGEDESERVHEARKALKEARALAKLMAGVIGPPAYEALRELEIARRRMGRARDLDVMPGALASLGGRVESRVVDALGRAIASERDHARAAHREVDVGAQVARLRAIARGVDSWNLVQIDLFDVVRSLRNAYRAARRRGRLALASGEPSELHALRASIVDLGHYFVIFEPAWPAHFTAFGHEFRRMREQLGKHNDLTVLAEFAASRPEISPVDGEALASAIEKRQKRLARRAERQFARLFAERPSALFDRISAYLENPIGDL